jgi:hypothetical protein
MELCHRDAQINYGMTPLGFVRSETLTELWKKTTERGNEEKTQNKR